MYRSRLVTLAMTTIATLFCSALIVTAQSTPEEKQTTEVELPKLNTPALPKPEIPKVEIPGGSTEKKQRKRNWMNVLHSISRFPETIEPKALLSFLNALSSSITLKANSAETTLRRSRKRKSRPKNPYGGLYSKVLLDGSFSPDHTHIGLKGAPQAKSVQADILN